MKKFQIVWKGQRFPDWLKKLLDSLEIFQTNWTFKMYFLFVLLLNNFQIQSKDSEHTETFQTKTKNCNPNFIWIFFILWKASIYRKKSFWKNWKFSRHNGIVVKCECNWGDWSLNQLLNEWMTTVLVKPLKLVKHPMALPQSAGKKQRIYFHFN